MLPKLNHMGDTIIFLFCWACHVYDYDILLPSIDPSAVGPWPRFIRLIFCCKPEKKYYIQAL